MNETAISQLYSFLIFVGIGILIVLIFDIFRIFRKSFKTTDIITTIEDIIFCVITGFILLYSIYKFNSGEIRLYIFLGITLGGVIYVLTISKFFIKISVKIIETIKILLINILKIIIFPFQITFKYIRKQFFKPISFFFINFKKFFTDINKKINIIIRKKKVKKGF